MMSPDEIRKIIKQYGLLPKKSMGQNFLIDEEALGKVVEAADLKKEDLVLEIGPGLGILTKELALRTKKVLAVELDRKAVDFLRHELKPFKNIEILEADILKMKNQEIFERLGGNYKLVSNLPYSITGRALRNFLTYGPKPKEIVLMLQREVAKRITAKPGDMSLVAVMAQFYGKPKITSEISKKSFFPEPEVESAIVKISDIEVKTKKAEDLNQEKFWQLAKIGFSSRRKQLKNNLISGLKLQAEVINSGLKQAGLNPLTRAEDLSVEEWIRLSEIFC